MKDTLLCIIGPTASGKTALAVALAKELNGAVISADSRQVYRGMNIGTGKDLDEYGNIPYYLIDIRTAGEHYNVSRFQSDFFDALARVRQSGLRPILCGGSGLYIQAVLQEFAFDEDRKVQRNAGLADTLMIGIHLPVDVRRKRITHRLQKRLDEGLIGEVENLLEQGISPEQLIFYGLEYKYTTLYLLGKMNYDTFCARLNTEIHRFAKRQMTYFRKMEKDGLKIHWIDGLQSPDENVKQIRELYHL